MYIRKFFVILLSTLILCSSLFSFGPIIHAQEKNLKSEVGKNANYYLIYYDGKEHEVSINDNLILRLTAWENQSKTKVIGTLEYKYNSVLEKETVVLPVSESLNEIYISDHESVLYRNAKSDFYKLEKVIPNRLENDVKVVVKNSNGTSIEEHIIVDEFGTVIESQGLKYYLIDKNNIKIEISEEDYQKLNFEQQSSIFEVNNPQNESENDSNSSTLGKVISTFSLTSTNNQPSILYQTHVQTYGWLAEVANGKMSGTEGEAKRLEAIRIRLDNQSYTGNIEYRTHVQSYGWLNWVKNGDLSGTEGEAKRLEAIQIRLTGEIAKHYDVYYRVHAQTYGWLDWAKNGEPAGTAGLSKRLEALEILLVKKDSKAPGSTNRPFVSNLSIKYSTHVQSYGWLKYVADGKMSGTEGEAKRLEAIKIQLENAPFTGGIQYRTHVQSKGWQEWRSNNQISGTEGESKRLEAIEIRLTGEMAQYYDVYYRVHAQTYGWLDWAKNGEPAGTAGLSKRLEAIEIRLVKKGAKAPGSTNRPFVTNPVVVYSTHVESYGWLSEVANGKMSGTEGEGKRLEAIKIYLKNQPYPGGIEYRTHVQSHGWLNWVKNGELSGTEGEAKRLEAIEIRLTGEMANRYDIYYRVHAQSFGWLGWAKNGQPAGTAGLSKRLEAIEIVLTEKGSKAPGTTERSFLQAPSVVYSTYVKGDGWLSFVEDGLLSGIVGKNKHIEAIKISLNHSPYEGGIKYSTHVQSEGWLDYVSDGKASGKETKRIEAIKIELTGEIAKYYDVYYRTFVSSIGWLGWAKNGMKAGTEGYAKPIEAIQIKLVQKGKGASVSETKSYRGKIISYTLYNLSLNDAVNMQMKVKPQTDSGSISETKKYAWVSKDYIQNGKVNASALNVRKGPGTGYASIGKLSNGQTVNILSEYNGWYAIEYNHRTWVHAIANDVEHYLNPNNFKDGTSAFFQFLKLSGSANIDPVEVNQKILHGKGILNGKANTFVEAGKKYRVNEVYLISHALLETGNGTSVLSNGSIKVSEIYYKQINNKQWEGKYIVFIPSKNNSSLIEAYTAEYKNNVWTIEKYTGFNDNDVKNAKPIYNMYGIGAVDSNPEIRGAIRAYQEGWFNEDKAIIEGAKFVAEEYIYAGQDTLYKMRWNPDSMEKLRVASHQYATDIGWAVKQTRKIKEIYDLLDNYTLEFDIPKYK